MATSARGGDVATATTVAAPEFCEYLRDLVSTYYRKKDVGVFYLQLNYLNIIHVLLRPWTSSKNSISAFLSAFAFESESESKSAVSSMDNKENEVFTWLVKEMWRADSIMLNCFLGAADGGNELLERMLDIGNDQLAHVRARGIVSLKDLNAKMKALEKKSNGGGGGDDGSSGSGATERQRLLLECELNFELMLGVVHGMLHFFSARAFSLCHYPLRPSLLIGCLRFVQDFASMHWDGSTWLRDAESTVTRPNKLFVGCLGSAVLAAIAEQRDIADSLYGSAALDRALSTMWYSHMNMLVPEMRHLKKMKDVPLSQVANENQREKGCGIPVARAWFGLLHHATKWLTSELWKWTSGPVNPITERPYPLICPFSFTDDPTAQKLRRRYITAAREIAEFRAIELLLPAGCGKKSELTRGIGVSGSAASSSSFFKKRRSVTLDEKKKVDESNKKARTMHVSDDVIVIDD